MSVTLWRIATEAPSYAADDLSGAGAKNTGGRWNDRGVAMVYASTTRALACLETMVHLNAGGLPLNRFLVEITVPDDVWAAADVSPTQHVDVGWDAVPPGKTSIEFGTAWVTSQRSALLIVPSIVVSEETNVLINPAHSDAVRIMARKARRWLYDPRLVQAN